MYSAVDSHLQASQCFPHYKSLIDCLDSQIFKKKVCQPYYLDFIECNTKEKTVDLINQKLRDALFEFEKRQSKLLYVPRYDPITDSFESTFTLPDGVQAMGGNGGQNGHH